VPEGAVTVSAPVWTDPRAADLHEDDVLVLAVKSHQAADALAVWADVPVQRGGQAVGTAGESLPLFCCTNGVAVEDIALRYVRRVFGVCVWSPAANLVPGEIIVRFAPTSAVLHAGRYPAHFTDDADRRLLGEIQGDWQRARLEVPLPEDVMEWKYRKLLSNLANAVDALLGPGVQAAALVQALQDEAKVVFAAAGVRAVDDATERAARRAGPRMAQVDGVNDDEVGSSTWQSLAKGAATLETDFLNGEIVHLAGLYGVPAPVNTALASLARRAAREGIRPGDLAVEEVERALGLRRLDS
jgi:2-dehydropantoate 2-reductase